MCGCLAGEGRTRVKLYVLLDIAKPLFFIKTIQIIDFVWHVYRLIEPLGLRFYLKQIVHALEEEMSPQIVMAFTGHEDYDSQKSYIAITDKTRKNLMTTMFCK